MKRLLLLLALLPSIALGGEFLEKAKGLYGFTGVMVPSDTERYKQLFLENESFEVVVDSPGGYLSVGIEMADFTRENNHRVRLTAAECYSAAALWVQADPDFRYRDKDSFLAFHLPWWSEGYSPTIGDQQNAGYLIGACIERSIGRLRAEPLMRRLSSQRDRHGTAGYVVWSRDEPERYGRWSWDPEGWVWDAGPESMREKPPAKNG